VRRASTWPGLRAGLILAAIVVSLVDGLPLPRMAPHHLRDPLNQRELARWSGYLDALGLEISPEALGARVVEVSARLGAVRAAAIAPARPLLDAFGLRQRFVLFPVAKTRLLWFQIEGRRRGARGDVLLYRPGDEAHQAPLPALEERKVRALWNAGSAGPNPELPAFAAWVAEALFRRDASLEIVRVGYRWLELDDPRARQGGLGERALEQRARAPRPLRFEVTVHR
jgi:hypothetical protein